MLSKLKAALRALLRKSEVERELDMVFAPKRMDQEFPLSTGGFTALRILPQLSQSEFRVTFLIPFAA